jgi:PAS domain S-box-containing protein
MEAGQPGRFSEVNQAACQLLGYTRDELLTRSVPDIEDAEAHARHGPLTERLRSGSVSYETEVVAKDGRRIPVEIKAAAFQTDGRLMVLSLVRDASERAQHALAEQKLRWLHDDLQRHLILRNTELKRANQRLDQANRELEAFAYSVAHDLRAPLRAIDGFSAALLRGYRDALDHQGTHYLERIRAGAQHMGQLVDDLLVLHQASRQELSCQLVDLSALARGILDELQAADPRRTVETHVADGMVAYGDPHLLRQALYNLLDNAWKFSSPRQTARIEVGAEVGRAVSAEVGTPVSAEAGPGEEDLSEAGPQPAERVFFVRDNGVGFDMAYSDRLFSPFQRLHSAREFPGTGIGLAIVRRIITRHGGRVWAQAKPDGGATFWFTLEAEDG